MGSKSWTGMNTGLLNERRSVTQSIPTLVTVFTPAGKRVDACKAPEMCFFRLPAYDWGSSSMKLVQARMCECDLVHGHDSKDFTALGEKVRR